MSKIDKFRDAAKNMVDQGLFHSSGTPDMSDMDNWICVHATNYLPRRNKKGQLYIPTTGMATGYKYPRATVHFTINQIVASNIGGNWDAQPVVILTPYNDTVAENGDPRMVASEDTFFIPDPDTGLVLPDSACIVRPNNDTLFNIGDKVSTYKTDHFTDEEIETILSFMSPWDRQQYEKYVNCDFSDNELQEILCWEGDLVRQNYEKSKNKRAFLRGLLEESRMVMLTKFLREMVVRMTMKKMGYDFVRSHEDKISAEIAEAASAKGIKGNSGNKGHSATFEKACEDIGCTYLSVIQTLQTNDIEKIYEFCSEGWAGSKELAELISTDKPLGDVYQLYVDEMKGHIDIIRYFANQDLQHAREYPDDEYYRRQAESAKKSLKYADKVEQGGIPAHNVNLDTVLHRNAARLNQEYAKAMEVLKQNPDYPLLKQMLTDLSRYAKKWVKTPDGWQPEMDIKDLMSIHGRDM